MPFDGIVLRAVVSELNGLLAGGRIEKIFQTERDEIVLACHAASSHYRLLISSNPMNPRIHLTTEKKANPMVAPPFSMVLRKYLQGARILSITQNGYDRVATLTAETRNEMGDLEVKHLVVEIMGRHSNIILLNHQGVIHDAIKHIDDEVSRVREIMPARRYVLPPAQDKLAPDSLTVVQLQEYFTCASKEKGVASWILSVISGFSPLLCERLCLSCEIDPKKPLGMLPPDAQTRLFQGLIALCSRIRQEQFSPAVLADGKDYHCMNVVWQEKGFQRKFNTVNLMLDEFYTRRDRQDRIRQRKSAVEKHVQSHLERVSRKMSIHQETRRQNEAYEQYKIYGDLLNGNIYALPEYAKEARLINYYEEDTPEIVIPLDESKTVSHNARIFFHKYKKAKSSYESSLKLIEEDLQELAYLQQVQAMIRQAEQDEDITEIRKELEEEGYLHDSGKKKHVPDLPSAPQTAFMGGKPASKKSLREKAAKERAKGKHAGKNVPRAKEENGSKPLHFTSPDGYRILVGRNNRQNDRLTLKDSQPEDLWFHVHASPGSHVILCTGEKHGVWSDRAIEMAAGLAAWYSGLRETSKADVDYAKVKYVKKIPGAHPGMVTYTNYKTITVVPKEAQQSLPHDIS